MMECCIGCSDIVVAAAHSEAGSRYCHVDPKDTTLSLPDFTFARLHFTFESR